MLLLLNKPNIHSILHSVLHHVPDFWLHTLTITLLCPSDPPWLNTASTTSGSWWDTRWTSRWSTTAPYVDWTPELYYYYSASYFGWSHFIFTTEHHTSASQLGQLNQTEVCLRSDWSVIQRASAHRSRLSHHISVSPDFVTNRDTLRRVVPVDHLLVRRL